VTSTYSIACSNVTGTSAVHSVTITVKPVVAPALVQFATHQTAGTNGENDSAVQFTAVTKANDTIWVAATLSDYAGVHAISVSDTQGNVYHLLNQKNDGAPGYQTVAHFYATNIVGDTVVPDTITVNWTYDNYKGVVIAEIDGATTASLVGRAADIQDGLAAGTDNVTSGNVAVASDKVPALMVGLSMNTSGGSSDLGGSGYGGPAAGTGFTPVAQFWQWGVNLATLETALITSAQSTAAVFDAPDTDSYVTVAVVFH